MLTLILISMSVSASETDNCLDCHSSMNKFPAVIDDWETSKHAQADITCEDCHTAKPDDPDAISHMGLYMTPVVSSADCGNCHVEAFEENTRSLHALGTLYYEVDFENEKLPYLESEVTLDGYDTASHNATINGCQACHGTNMTDSGVDDPAVWPNNGIGRINPDGSLGSCSSCHTRHAFSVEEARKPESCQQCHIGPDHPQTEIFFESKHGSIYSTEGENWDWTSEQWEAGEDYRAPTCAACHMSGTDDLKTTHDVSSRLSWELEPPVSRHTDNTANILGVPISDGTTWQEKRERMTSVCEQCHSETWVDNYYVNADAAVELYNKKYEDSNSIVTQLREDELLTEQAFDEPIEFKIYEFWHHEGRRARMGAFMMGPDYVQWHGFYELLKDKAEIVEMNEQIRLNAQLAEELNIEVETENKSKQTPGFEAFVAFSAIGILYLGLRKKL